ncbi:MAG: NUDIX hydrolase [Anaerolineae bacterium]|mgnify:FL=1|jgi:ADP-ribose pyrophosphatase|nr:NUDIX hydrolase [Anaerolineae bacterium]MDX9830618.1 NUDIX hydrolase [Anaerolineae bacterium]
MMWECLSSRYLWQSPWYSLREDRVRTPEGREFTFTLVDHPGAVCIVPVTAEGQVVLIRNYRYPVGEHCLEVPAGGLSSDASAEEAARRELEEEVGGTADALQYVGRFYASNGISNEIVHVYLATGVELGEPDRETTEEMERRLVGVDEALRMARSGEISDALSALALLWCEELLRDGKGSG